MTRTAQSIFVTGTDTGVGKTLIAQALIHAYARAGMKAAGMKPVASGAQATPEGLRNEDALALIAQANVPLPYALVNPYCFEPAIAPHIAAAEAGVRMNTSVLLHAHAEIAARADKIIVEGAGGWLTPLNQHETLADFAAAIHAEVVLVVGLRLGCINHALLTAQAIDRAGLSLAGWVANTVDPDMPRMSENIQTLTERLPGRLMGVVPHFPVQHIDDVARCVSLVG